MDADPRLEEIRAREQAATKGPWEWRTWLKGKEIHLQTVGWDAVMMFARWGMNSAQPQFRTDDLLVDGKDLLRQNGREVDHPDAEFIAHARADVTWLVAELTEARTKLAIAERRNEELADTLVERDVQIAGLQVDADADFDEKVVPA